MAPYRKRKTRRGTFGRSAVAEKRTRDGQRHLVYVEALAGNVCDAFHLWREVQDDETFLLLEKYIEELQQEIE